MNEEAWKKYKDLKGSKYICKNGVEHAEEVWHKEEVINLLVAKDKESDDREHTHQLNLKACREAKDIEIKQWKETCEIMSDPETMKGINKSMKQLMGRQTIPLKMLEV